MVPYDDISALFFWFFWSRVQFCRSRPEKWAIFLVCRPMSPPARKRCTPLRTTKELLNDGCGRQVVPLTGISDAQITTSRSSPTLHNPRSLAHLCYPVPPAVGVPCPRPAVESRSEPDESYSRYEFTYSQHYPYSELLPMPEDPFNVGLVKRPSKS